VSCALPAVFREDRIALNCVGRGTMHTTTADGRVLALLAFKAGR
jgi:hypothetical protein